MTVILMTMLYYYVCKQDHDVLVGCFMFVTLAIRQSG